MVQIIVLTDTFTLIILLSLSLSPWQRALTTTWFSTARWPSLPTAASMMSSELLLFYILFIGWLIDIWDGLAS